MAILQEGKSRPLTIGEIALARTIFSNAITYSQVKVHNGSYLPFNMQARDVAMTPDGEIYFREPHYKDDFSTENSDYKHWFIHEMVHVIQHQIGMNVRTRGLVSWAVDYQYSLPPEKKLADFGMEQQAAIIADFYLLIYSGIKEYQRMSRFKGIIGPNLKEKYNKTLEVFLKNPKDKRAYL